MKSKVTRKIIKIGTALTLAVSAVGINTVNNTTVEAFNWFKSEEGLSQEDLDIINDVYRTIRENYIDEIDKEVLIEGALKGMADAVGDPYSEYFNSEESKAHEEELSDSFEGIGVEITQRDGKTMVVTPIDDTPADKAGLTTNDFIIEADGVDLTGMSVKEVADIIRGPKGEEITLKIERAGAVFEVTLERDTIPLLSVKTQVDEDNPEIANVRITQFAENTYNELVDNIKELRDEGVEKFVFDLRSNPGGYLDQALRLSNMFLEEDDIIMQVSERNATFKYAADDKEYGDFKITEPYVILIDQGSASASEILAAAIKENTDSDIIGQTSFGKGTVQTITEQSKYGELKLTIARWLTPSGEWVHEEGVSPTIEVEPHPATQALILDSSQEYKKGDSNEFIESISLMLDALSYPIDSDTTYDETMEESVKAFQKDHDLEVDGVLTGDTTLKLVEKVREFLTENDLQYQKAVDVLKES